MVIKFVAPYYLSIRSELRNEWSLGGRAVCQGREEYGKTEAPEEEHFVQLVAGTYFTCGLTFDQRVRCWGRINAPPTEGLYLQLSAGSFYSCGLLIDGQIDCWGQSRVVTDVKNFAAQDRSAAHFEQISCGSETCCALNYEGKLHCWGALIVTNTTASELDTLEHTVFTGETQSAQVGISKATVGNNEFDEIFSQISSGDSLACGILFPSGDLRCWGQVEKHSLKSVNKGPFIQVMV